MRPRQTTAPIGERFGRLTVVGFIGYQATPVDPHQRLRWLCRCDCGTERVFAAQSVKKGDSRSCGCLQREITSESQKGKPGRSRKSFGASSLTLLRCIYRTRARRRDRVFLLTVAEFNSLVTGDCHYCGAPPSNLLDQAALHGHLVYNGIDRVDNTIGYVVTNCVPCCAACNRAKGAMSGGEFVELARRIASRHPTD